MIDLIFSMQSLAIPHNAPEPVLWMLERGAFIHL